MGNYASSALITTDNKTIQLGHAKDAKDQKVWGQCDGQNINTCNYKQSDLTQLLSSSGSSTNKIKQVVAGAGTLVYIYDQDNYSGNKYIVYPNTTIIVPPCFTINSVKHKVFTSNNKINNEINPALISIEQFDSVNSCSSKFIVKRHINNNYVIFVVIIIIILMYIYRKKLFSQNK